MIVQHTQQLFLVLLLGTVITVTSSLLLRADNPLPAPLATVTPAPAQPHAAAVITAVPDTASTNTAPTETSQTVVTRTPAVSTQKNVKRTTVPNASAPQPVITELNDTTYMTEIIRLINQHTNTYRTANKRTPLTTDSALARNADSYSHTLLAGQFLSHTDKNGCDMTCRFTQDGYIHASALGENLGVLRFEERPTPEYVANYFMNAWKKSARHKANLLSTDYTYTGIGVTLDTNSLYIAVQFARPK
jgi:uncharacterized protein YkwD